MRIGHRVIATLAAIMVTATAAQAASNVVAVEGGKLRGSESEGVSSWKGIPFAAPPVGANRWRAPQPAAAWKGVRDATQYSHDCMQLPFPSDAAPLGTTPAEDCLYANVWRPARFREEVAGDLLDLRRWLRERWRVTAHVFGREPGEAGRAGLQRQLSRRPLRHLRTSAAHEGERGPGKARQLRLHGPDRRAQLGTQEHRRVRRRSGQRDHHW